LRCPDVCGFQLRRDDFLGEPMIAPAGTEEWRRLRDTDYMELMLRAERLGFQSIGKETMRDAVAYTAEKNAFDSARHWLGPLKWDGVGRVDGFLAKYFGSSDTPYTRAVGRFLWTALAGRVMVPGVKVDMAPVAVGAQGMGKTTAVAAMAPSPEFFASIDLALRDIDLARAIRGKLVIELGELIGLRMREIEQVKSFMSRQHEEWVPKYHEMPIRYARRCVFFGTSNKDDFLSDETGNRRWLPFRSGKCDPDGIARDREQLWAEGRDLFARNGVLFSEAERLAEAEHAGFTEHDDWEDSVNDWLNRPDFGGSTPISRDILRSSDVLRSAINLPPSQQTRAHQQRIKKVLLRLGFIEGSKRIDGQKVRGYVPPSLF